MSLNEYRNQIDNIDKVLFVILEKRMDIASKIGILKKNKQIEHIDRENAMRESMYMHSSLKKEYIDQLYNVIFSISKKYQREI